MDSSSASGLKWKLVQRNGCGSVEVMSMLLQPAERLEFGRNKNTGLFELVTRSQKDISQSPAENAVQSQFPAPSASPANLGPIVDPCPVFLSDKAVLSSSVQKDRGLEVAPRECSLIRGSGMSSFRAIQACEDKSCPLSLRSATGRGLDIVTEEPDVVANQSHQMVKSSIKDFLFDANIDKDELFESTSSPLMIPTKPMPIKMNPYEDKSRLASSSATQNGQLTCSHSDYCRNKHCQKRSCSPLPYTEKRVNIVERTSKQFIHPMFGGFLSSTFIERKGKIIQGFSELEVSGPIQDSQRSSKFLVMPDRINLDAIPSCSIRDAGTLRISTAVDKVERVPGEPSKFSKTTHSFLLTNQCDMSVSREDQLARKLLSDAENYPNAFLKMADFISLSYLHEKKDIRTKFFSKSSRTTNPLNLDFNGHHFSLSRDAESGSPSNSARDSSPKSRDNNEICAQASGYAAYFEQPHAILNLKENFANTSSSTAGQNHLDLNTTLTSNSSEGLATDMIDKDSREAETAYERLQKITLEKETEFGNMNTNVSMSHGDVRSYLYVNGSNEKGMCTLKAQNSSAETPYRPVCEPSGFSDPASGQNIGWVKRLKRNDSEAFGTKNSVLGDTFPEHKRTKLLNKAGDQSRFFASSDYISSPWIKKQRLEFAKGVTTPRQSKSAAELLKESRLILSSPWLQRLRPREGQAKQTGPAEFTGEPANCPNKALEMQSEKSPTSLGAMALLGKVMRNFSKCGFSKNGSSMVWKAEELKEECHPEQL